MKRPKTLAPLTVVSDGTASGTFVRDNRTGHRVPGVTGIEIDPITSGDCWTTARLTVLVGLDLGLGDTLVRREARPPSAKEVSARR